MIRDPDVAVVIVLGATNHAIQDGELNKCCVCPDCSVDQLPRVTLLLVGLP